MESSHGAGWVRLVVLVIGTLVFAIACALALEISTALDWPASWGARHLGVGVVLIWMFVWLLLVATGRAWLTLGVTATIVGAVSIANAVKVSYLREPLVVADLGFVTEPGFLFAMVPPVWVAVVVAGFAVMVVLLVLLARRFPLPPPWRTSDLTRARRLSLQSFRVVTSLVLAATLIQATRFHVGEHNVWRLAFEANGAEWMSWDAYDNYVENGFVGGFLYSEPIAPMLRPDGYSRSAVTGLAAEYGAADPPRPSLDESDAPNVVVVLCETCSDPLALPGVELPQDPLRNFRRLAEESWSGNVADWTFGGGTSVMEFEILTGQSMALFTEQLQTPYADVVAPRTTYPSVVEWFNRSGYDSTAIHSFRGTFYRRHEAYRSLNFARFIDEEEMSHTERFGKWISDESAFQETLDVLEQSDAPQFVHVVTMQNHTPSYKNMPHPMQNVTSPYADAEDLGRYASGLRETDRALGEFIASVNQLDRPTTLLFFGDHLPPFYDAPATDGRRDAEFLESPFLIWSTDQQDRGGRDLGTVSPTTLMPMLFAREGLPAPPYFTLLRQQQRLLGSLRPTEVVDSGGESTAYDELTPTQETLLRKMRLLQYDLSVGGEYTRQSLWGI